MKTKTTKRNTARVAALSSAMAVLGTGVVLPFADAQTADTETTPVQTSGYVVDTTRDGFAGDSNGGWNLVGTACLTPGATGNGNNCASTVGWNNDPQLNKGWLQLTNAEIPQDPNGAFGTNVTFKNGDNIGATSNANQRGSALFNSNIPAARGLDIQFEQVQGGGSTRRMWAWNNDQQQWHYILDPTRGADGIGFYLVDGTKTQNLTKPGTYGAGLGYTQGTADSGQGADGQSIDLAALRPWSDPSKLVRSGDRDGANSGVVDAVNGVDNGVIGVGLDAFGNFSSKKYGMGYTTDDTYRIPGAIDGYTWEEAAMATAKDPKGKPACVRDIHPGKNPRLNVDITKLADFNYALDVVRRGLAGDCSIVGLITVQEKAAQFGELPYNAGFDAQPYREGRFGEYTGISYWEPRTDVLTLRGPGNGINGYQLLATRGSIGNSKDQGEISTAFGMRSFRAQTNNQALVNTVDKAASIIENRDLSVGDLDILRDALSLTGLNTLNEDNFNVHPSSTYYKYVRVTIDKKVSDDQPVEVTVSATNTPPDPSKSHEENLARFTNASAISLKSSIPGRYVPEQYKFGFSASTGAGTDVHAIRDVKIRALEGGLVLDKTVSIAGGKDKAGVGDILNYNFKVTNSGEAALTAVNVADPIVNDVRCEKNTLAPDESTTCTGTHKLTEEDVKNTAKKSFGKAEAQGLYNTASQRTSVTINNAPSFESGFVRADQFVNQAVAYGLNLDSDAANGGMVFSNVDEAAVPFGNVPPAPNPEPSIDLVKEVVGKTSGYKVGEDVKYKFTITNNGDSALNNVVFNDDKATLDGGDTSCNRDALAPGESYSCTGVHKLAEGEFVDNKFVNNADVTGKDPQGREVNDDDTATVTPAGPGEPGIQVTKEVDGEQKASYKVGETVPYLFTVENIGAVKLTDVHVTDAKFTEEENANIRCEETTLEPGEKTSCRGTHTLVDEDVATGTFHNTATGVGTPPDGTPVEDEDDHDLPTDPERGLKLEKVVNEDSDLAKDKYLAGDKVPYRFTVTNDGKVDLVNVMVEDAALDAPATCEATDLAVNESTTCEGVHTLTEDEVAQPEFVNIAQAFGEDPTKAEDDPERKVPSNKDQAVVEFPNEALGLVKEVDAKSELAKSVYAAGDKVPYLFTVTNEGNVKIDNIAIEDEALDAPATCDASSLDAGESTECRGVHTLTEDEAASGQFRNVATATGTNPDGDPVRSPEDDEIVPTSKNELILDKQVDNASDLAKDTYQAGDKVPYLFNVKNNGPVEIHDLVVVDGALDGDATCDTTVLAPGADTNCRGVHTLTEAEAAQGEFLNVAYASGLDPQDNPVNSNEDQEIVPTAVPRGPLASTGASVLGLAGLALASALVGFGALGIRRRNV